MANNEMQFLLLPWTDTFTRSTLKSKEADSSRFTSSTANMEAAADVARGVGGMEGGASKEDLELIARQADGEQKSNDYEVPVSITTKFGEPQVKAEGSFGSHK